jgi:hypothetical protein
MVVVMVGQKREARLHADVRPSTLWARFKDVDARDKPGHDESNDCRELFTAIAVKQPLKKRGKALI